MVYWDYLKSIYKGLRLFILYLIVSEVLGKIVSFIGARLASVDHKLTRSPLIHLLRIRFGRTIDDPDFVSGIIFNLCIIVVCITSLIVRTLVRRPTKTFISILAFFLVPCPFIIWLLVDSCVSIFNIVMVSVMFFLYVSTSIILTCVIPERTNANKTGKNISHRVRYVSHHSPTEDCIFLSGTCRLNYAKQVD